MHKLKAQGWQIQEITKLFLVLIIGLLIAVFIINASGSLSGLAVLNAADWGLNTWPG